MDKPTPFRRDWLKEAYMIAKGDQSVRPKKDHVTAAINALIDIKAHAEQLRTLMGHAYNEACKKRKAEGLEIPPPPKILLGTKWTE